MAMISVSMAPGGKRPSGWYSAMRATAAVAALFTLVVGALLAAGHFRGLANDPLRFQPMLEAKEQLQLKPMDEALKQRIRALDLEVRERYFRWLRVERSGAWLLLGGVLVFLVATRQVVACGKGFSGARPAGQRSPDGAGPGRDPWAARRGWRCLTDRVKEFPSGALVASDARQRMRDQALARRSVAFSGATLLVVVLGIGAAVRTSLPQRPGELERWLAAASPAVAAATNTGPTLAELEHQWPRFRGFNGGGVATCTNPPMAWNGVTGQGVVWKTLVPLPGPNSPVVWADRVFVSGGDATQRAVFCFDAGSGALLWQRPVQVAPTNTALPKVSDVAGFAAPTVATDGRRVYAIFATGELAAFDLDGRPVWGKFLGVPNNPYGHASSPVCWQGRLLVQFDQGPDRPDHSELYAFDGATGRVIWRHPRQVPSSWATPIVIEASRRPLVITLGEPWVIAYDAINGNEVWRAKLLGSDLAPSPIFAGGLVYYASPWKELGALRPDGQGDVTATARVWSVGDNVPDIPSPVSDGRIVFALTGAGFLTAVDAGDGRRLWDHDLGMDCHASPTLAGDRLYVMGTKGSTVIIAADREFKELGRAELGEPIYASPAIVRDRIYLRGTRHLFCLGTTWPGSRVAANYGR